MVRSFKKKLEDLKAQRKWQELIVFLEENSRLYPNEYFIFTILSEVYCKIDNKEKALATSERAMAIEDRDILVLYNYAMSLVLNNRYSEAIVVFDRILNKRLKTVAYGHYGEGIKWTRSIFNDSRYLKGLCYKKLDNHKEAYRLIKLHLSRRKRGIYSDFTRRHVLKTLNELSDLMNHVNKSQTP